MNASLRVSNLHKRFGDLHVLKGVELEANKGDVLCLIGPSGSGKSTLLRCLNQLEQSDLGVIMVNGEIQGYRHVRGKLHPLSERDRAKQRAEFGMVFQHFNLFPHMSAIENVTEGPRSVKGWNSSSDYEYALSLLERVGLSDKRDAFPYELSGGQQQRVAIARALALRPQILLFDEPTSSLDPELVGEVLTVIRDLAEQGTTMIIVTHELGFVRSVATHVAFMDQGELIAYGAPSAVLDQSNNSRIAEFVSAVM